LLNANWQQEHKDQAHEMVRAFLAGSGKGAKTPGKNLASVV
jgi:hypothetical protein